MTKRIWNGWEWLIMVSIGTLSPMVLGEDFKQWRSEVCRWTKVGVTLSNSSILGLHWLSSKHSGIWRRTIFPLRLWAKLSSAFRKRCFSNIKKNIRFWSVKTIFSVFFKMYCNRVCIYWRISRSFLNIFNIYFSI